MSSSNPFRRKVELAGLNTNHPEVLGSNAGASFPTLDTGDAWCYYPLDSLTHKQISLEH